MELTVQLILLFFVVAMVAGCVDAIAGGGGLITIPVLLAAGLPPALAIATNKLGGVAGTFSATMHFVRIGEIKLNRIFYLVPPTFLGAVLGGFALTKIDGSFLALLVPFLLVGFSTYFLFSPNIGTLDKKQKLSLVVFGLTMAPLIGFYDGFFGPGTGTFFCLAFTLLLGFNIVKATAHAKLLNLASNFSALLFFILHGSILWNVGIVMMLGQFIGGYLGARLVVKNGTKLIKGIMVVVAVALSVKMVMYR
ncbi:MAG: TSUP family transporter [Janthinobacterium lividum]